MIHLRIWGMVVCVPTLPAPTTTNTLVYTVTRIRCHPEKATALDADSTCPACYSIALYCAVNKWANSMLHTQHTRRFALAKKNHGAKADAFIAAFRRQQLEYLLKRVSEGK